MIFTYFYHQAGLLHFLHFCGLFGGFFSPVCIGGNGRKAQGFHKSLASLDQSICKLQDDQFALFLPHKSNLACYASRRWIWCIDVHWMIAFCQAHIAYVSGCERCVPDKKQSFNAHQCTKFMQCRALHSIGRNRWSCVSEQLFVFFGSCSPSYEQTMNPHMPNGLPFFVVIVFQLHGAPNFFLHIDHSQNTPHATAAWIGSDMGRMRNIDLQQVHNLQCYTAFTDKNMGSTSGTIVTYQRWIAKSGEGLINIPGVCRISSINSLQPNSC